jgi:hypothetical protein
MMLFRKLKKTTRKKKESVDNLQLVQKWIIHSYELMSCVMMMMMMTRLQKYEKNIEKKTQKKIN